MKVGNKTEYDGILNIPEGKSGTYEISHVIRPAGTQLISGNMRTAMYGQKAEKILYKHETKWHQLSEDGSVWMTDDPIEQRQHDESLVGASGRVLVGGLGLGYAVTVLAKDPAVKEIVVVEISQDVANLVWAATIARSSRSGLTLTLIVEDLFIYLKNLTEHFDWAYFDIWQTDSESTFHNTVVPLRKLASPHIDDVVCWNEDIMRGQLCQGLQSRILMLTQSPTDPTKNLFNMDLPDVNQFAIPNGSIWVDWAAPFWTWFRDKKPSKSQAEEVAAAYSRAYGRDGLDIAFNTALGFFELQQGKSSIFMNVYD
jgi:hypothetical protein